MVPLSMNKNKLSFFTLLVISTVSISILFGIYFFFKWHLLDSAVSNALLLSLSTNYFVYVPLGMIGIWRWGVWVFKKICSMHYKAFDSSNAGQNMDFSIITPVFKEDPVTFKTALESWQENNPNEIIAVIDQTDTDCINTFKEFSIDKPMNKLIITAKPGKREALVDGIKIAKSEILALTDSDTIWKSKIKDELLAPFGNSAIGAVTTRVHPIDRNTLWQKITDFFWDMRNYLDLPAQTAMGQSLSCLSGRTSLYRRQIILPKLDLFLNEIILGKIKESGEDKCLTRLVQSEGWKTYYQQNAIVYSSASPDFITFCKQRIRWSRNSHNSDILSLWQGWVWNRPFLAFCMIDRIISTFTLFFGPIFFTLSLIYGNFLLSLAIFCLWVGGRSIKVMPHLRRYPKDMILIIPFLGINYLMAILKLYALISIRDQKFIRARIDAEKSLKKFSRITINVIGTCAVIIGLVCVVRILL